MRVERKVVPEQRSNTFTSEDKPNNLVVLSNPMDFCAQP
jgi:hypothetical protein